MCFGGGGNSQPQPTPQAAPDPGVKAQASEWSSRRKRQNSLTELKFPKEETAVSSGPTTALRKLMGA